MFDRRLTICSMAITPHLIRGRHNRIFCVHVMQLWQIPPEPVRGKEASRDDFGVGWRWNNWIIDFRWVQHMRLLMCDRCQIFDVRCSLQYRLPVSAEAEAEETEDGHQWYIKLRAVLLSPSHAHPPCPTYARHEDIQ